MSLAAALDRNPLAEPAALRHPAAWDCSGGVPARGRPGRPAHRAPEALERILPGRRADSAPKPGTRPLSVCALLYGRRLVPFSRKWLIVEALRRAAEWPPKQGRHTTTAHNPAELDGRAQPNMVESPIRSGSGGMDRPGRRADPVAALSPRQACGTRHLARVSEIKRCVAACEDSPHRIA